MTANRGSQHDFRQVMFIGSQLRVERKLTGSLGRRTLTQKERSRLAKLTNFNTRRKVAIVRQEQLRLRRRGASRGDMPLAVWE
jgi:hypothetical protein